MIDIKYRALAFAALLMALTTGNAFKIMYIDTLFISIHENITTEAISKKSIRLANNRVIQFTSGALAYVIEANTESDELHFDAPDYHFDEDRFAESTSNLEAWKKEIAKAAIEDNISSSLTNFHVQAPGAHDLLGRSLHLVQDFYAHSSWVDIKQVNKKLRHPRFGQADALNHIALDDAGVQRAGWNESMAACDAAGYIAASNLLTTGYYDAGMSLADVPPAWQGSYIVLLFPHITPYSLLIADENQRAGLGFYTKEWKAMIGNHWPEITNHWLDSRCIHGGDTGPGLNKDKPGRPWHEEASKAAITGSAMFLDEVIAEIRKTGGKDADRAVCALLGHKTLSDCDMPIELATVDRITSDAATAFIGEAIKFIVLGSNIPGSAAVTMENATCELYTAPSSNGFTAICIPYRPGNSDVKVIGAFGDEPLKTKSYNVEVANLQVYPSISEIYQKISFTLSNVYLVAKNAEWSISDALGKIAMGVSVGVEKTVSYVFEKVGKWTIDVAFLDTAGKPFGTKVSKVIEINDSVSGTANITSVKTASGVEIPEASSTPERRPKLSGTLSTPISSYFSVWVYLDDVRLAPATVDGTSWTYTSASDILSGHHKFTVGVIRFDGAEGNASAARRLTVVNEVGAGDLGANFSSSKNPNGQWSYGWISTAPGAQFITFDKPEQYTNVPPLFYDAANANLRYWTAGTPYSLFVAANIGSTLLVFRGVPWQGNSVWQHPGQNGEMAVSRWVAPKSGTFKINAAFSLLENGSVDVRILKNGLPLFSDYLSSSKMATSNSAMGNVDITAGDKLDLVVGYGGDNYLADETMVSVSITPATANDNILLGAAVTDSCPVSCNPAVYGSPSAVTDGNPATARNLGTYSGYFTLTPVNPISLAKIVLTPSMSPNGPVDFEIRTSTDAPTSVTNWVSHGRKGLAMANLTDIEVPLLPNTIGVRVVQIIFHSSPSWVALFEAKGFAEQ